MTSKQTQCACRDCMRAVSAKTDNNLELCQACEKAGCDEWSKSSCARPDFVAPVAFGASGYTDCACRDCFDIAVSDDMAKPDLCWECSEAGCSDTGDEECARDDAYGQEGDEDGTIDCG